MKYVFFLLRGNLDTLAAPKGYYLNGVVLASFVEALWRVILQNLPAGGISPLFL